MEVSLTILLDWGDTLMRVLPYDGPMADWPKVAAVPGARRALAGMYGRARLVVVSNAQASGPDEVRRALARVRLEQYIADVLTPAVVGKTKDDEGFWPAVLARLGAGPGEVIVVGDDYDRDIAPAARMGVRTVWLANSDQSRGDTTVITNMRDLPAAIGLTG
jgi:putative hydrolase of the HAD superfamily